MSTDSLISIPPRLNMIPRSFKKLSVSAFNTVSSTYNFSLENNEIGSNISNTYQENFEDDPNLPFNISPNSTLVKLTEDSFPVMPDQPINLKITLRPAQPTFTTFKPKKVSFLFEIYYSNDALCALHIKLCEDFGKNQNFFISKQQILTIIH